MQLGCMVTLLPFIWVKRRKGLLHGDVGAKAGWRDVRRLIVTRTSYRGFLMLHCARVTKLASCIAVAFLSMAIVQSIPAQGFRRPLIVNQPPPQVMTQLRGQGNSIPAAVQNAGSKFGSVPGVTGQTGQNGQNGQNGNLGNGGFSGNGGFAGNVGTLGGNVGGFAGNFGQGGGNFGVNGGFGGQFGQGGFGGQFGQGGFGGGQFGQFGQGGFGGGQFGQFGQGGFGGQIGQFGAGGLGGGKLGAFGLNGAMGQ
jgi:hypothetical protein